MFCNSYTRIFKCFSVFAMFQKLCCKCVRLFYLYIVSVLFVCFKSRSSVAHVTTATAGVSCMCVVSRGMERSRQRVVPTCMSMGNKTTRACM